MNAANSAPAYIPGSFQYLVGNHHQLAPAPSTSGAEHWHLAAPSASTPMLNAEMIMERLIEHQRIKQLEQRQAEQEQQIEVGEV